MSTTLPHINKTEFTAQQHSIHQLYDKYAGMLLGYITTVVKDATLAEKYLVKTFTVAAANPVGFATPGANYYCRLQQMARQQMAPFFDTVKSCDTDTALAEKSTGTFKMMTPLQKGIFCGVYYQGKTIAELCTEYNKDELSVRIILKEAFVIIRNSKDAPIY